MTACKRSTNSLPKLSLITLPRCGRNHALVVALILLRESVRFVFLGLESPSRSECGTRATIKRCTLHRFLFSFFLVRVSLAFRSALKIFLPKYLIQGYLRYNCRALRTGDEKIPVALGIDNKNRAQNKNCPWFSRRLLGKETPPPVIRKPCLGRKVLPPQLS